MPNYYIQATRGHFNPLSFDELVKPLNMYKEYYDENEKAITEMRSQADLWDEIMKSEGNTDLANKYNQYTQDLNDAAQQLTNGMSYNLRKQIQDLRAKSAMVKQIENAYALKSKDVETYNELMMKDPSRIGAFDPSQRSLNDYMRGPVTNEYGVSGDRLYTLGNARAKAMSAQKDVFEKPASVLGKQYFELKEKTGFSDAEIAQMLKEKNPIIFDEIDRIIQQEGTSLNNQADLNKAEAYVLNGMLSGFTFNEDRKYLKDDSYMNPWEAAKAQLDIDKKTLERDILQLKYDKEIAETYGDGIDPRKLAESYSGNDVKLFGNKFSDEFVEKGYKDLLDKANNDNRIENKEGVHYDPNGNLTTKSIGDLLNLSKLSIVDRNDNKLFINPNEIPSDNLDVDFINDIEYFKQNKGIKNIEYKNGQVVYSESPEIKELRKKYNYREKSNGEIDYDIDDILNTYNQAINDSELISGYRNYLNKYHVLVGENDKEKSKLLYNFNDETNQIKNYGGIDYDNATGRNGVVSILKNILNSDSNFTLKEENTGKELDHDKSAKIIKNNFTLYPTNNGYTLVDDKKKGYKIISAASDLINNYNQDTFVLNMFIRNPWGIVDAFVNDGGLIQGLNENSHFTQINNSNFYYTLFNKNGKLFTRLVNGTNNKYIDFELYNVNDWKKASNDLLLDEAYRLKKQASSKSKQD